MHRNVLVSNMICVNASQIKFPFISKYVYNIYDQQRTVRDVANTIIEFEFQIGTVVDSNF